MTANPKKSLRIYVWTTYVLFAILFYLNYRTISTNEWMIISVFTGIAALFEVRRIILPTNEYLSISSPLLVTLGIIHGIFPVMIMVALVAILLTVYRPNKWTSISFNSVQYAFSAFVALLGYQAAGGIVGTFHLEDFLAYLAFAVLYFTTNTMLVVGYMAIDYNAAFREVLKRLVQKQALLIYFSLLTFGVLMAVVLQAEGLAGVIIFSMALWFVGVTYRGYYEMYDHFRSLSIKDELTGLYNHRYFQEKLQELLNNKQTVSLLLMDLDYFKLYNDMFGHPKGDELLQEISKVIMSQIPQNGFVCRYGGEEFAILLPNTGPDEAVSIAETVRMRIAEQPFFGAEHMPKQQVTISIGVATYPDMAYNKEMLIMLADEALYKVKYSNRNRVQLYASVIDELKSNFQFGAEDTEMLKTIRTFLTIINSKDRYTYGHTERGMKYAEMFARKIGLSEETVKYIRFGALLHDIGKVEVPADILNKRSPLSEEEWEILKMHVIWGEEIVRPVKELAPCLPMIRHHHERYDGKGYPDGLAGKDIPLEARILTVVDSFDAMMTQRPYQKARTIAEAIEELRSCAGSQFDPELIEPFIEIVQELHLGQTKKMA